MTMKNCFVHLVIISILCSTAFAQKTAQGYIIGLQNDTIPGSFNLQKFKGDMFYKPFNWGMFAVSVFFTKQDGTEVEYPAGQIKGFDLDYKGEHYKYRSLNTIKADPQVLMSDDAPAFVFANLVVEAEPISFYIFRFNYDVFHKYKGVASKDNYYHSFYAVKNGKLISLEHTLKKDELRTTMRDVLTLEEEFIATVPKKYGYYDLEKVIVSYNEWKKSH